MRAKLISPPAELPVTMTAAITAARAEGAGLESEIEQAVRTYVGEAEFETQRAIITQTLRVTRNDFPAFFELPRPNLLTVVHVRFCDSAGHWQTLDPQDYTVDTESTPGRVLPAPGKAWPATAARINCVEVQYTAGYGPTHADVPDSIKGFILRRVAEQFGQLSPSMASSAPRLLDAERIYS